MNAGGKNEVLTAGLMFTTGFVADLTVRSNVEGELSAGSRLFVALTVTVTVLSPARHIGAIVTHTAFHA